MLTNSFTFNRLRSTISEQSQLRQVNTIVKKPIKVEFSSSQNFLSPNRDKVVSPTNEKLKIKSQR